MGQRSGWPTEGGGAAGEGAAPAPHLLPVGTAAGARSHPCPALFFPHSYFESSVFPVRPLSRGPAGFVSTRLLKDNAQMGALVGGLGRAAGGLIQAW